ncbi:MAG: hypothetical protein VX527_03290, partial [Planctomycetota bacterium]|nr:hypothetical protein [Planctomycetota bacterium]
MKSRPRALVLTASVVASSVVLMPALPVGAFAGEMTGPDVVDFYVANSINYLGSVEGIGGYAFGTTSCNWGDMVADWYGGTNNTPLIGQNAYRLKNGRFEQIGTSWLKHSFCALSEGGCGDCQATDCNTLGIGCADTYGAGLNTNPGGPRSEVNAFLGTYEYPFTNSPSGVATLRGNLCIADNDVDPALNEGARYFFEGFYVCTDEAPWGTQFNNASWREISFSGPGEPSTVGSTQVAEMAIRTWKHIDPEVMLTDIMVPNDGLIVVGSKVTELSNGTWRYEYAIYNYNCDRSVGAVAITIPEGATATNVGFHDVDYHSGEVWDSTDWLGIQADGQLRWSTTTYAENPLANAIRWDSLYNVRFDVPSPPMTGELSLELFKPGGIPSITAEALVPKADPIDPCDLPLDNCATDIDGSMVVDVADVLSIIEDFGDCGDGTFRPEADVDGDCCVTVGDILEVISQWGDICAEPGACCLADGACVDITELECFSSGGNFNGIGIPCYDVNCPIPGACCLSDVECAVLFLDDCLDQDGDFRGYGTSCEQIDCSQAEYNNDCQDAWLVTDGDHEFSTMSATTDGSAHEGCEFDGQTYNDIWFRYTTTCNGLLAVSTCNLVNYDSDLVVYRGWDCDNLELLDCNDDGPGCAGYSSHIEIPVLEGEEILIRVGG